MHNQKTLDIYRLLLKDGMVRDVRAANGWLVVTTKYTNKDGDRIEVTLGDSEGYSEDAQDIVDNMLEKAARMVNTDLDTYHY